MIGLVGTSAIASDIVFELDTRLQLSMKQVGLVEQKDEGGASKQPVLAYRLPQLEGVRLQKYVVNRNAPIDHENNTYKSVDFRVLFKALIETTHGSEEDYRVDILEV